MGTHGRSRGWLPALLCVAVLGATTARAQEEGASPGKIVGEHSRISMEYTLTIGDEVFDSTVGKDPVLFQLGTGAIVQGLERELIGLGVGESKHVTVLPEDAYGLVDPQALKVLDPELVPEEHRQVGAQVILQDPEGRQAVVTVIEVSDERVVVDMNHPLAGQVLEFDVKVLAIADEITPVPPAPEPEAAE
jgi:FKBP-type peptidyl-prolyl cis-trans isomerase 2